MFDGVRIPDAADILYGSYIKYDRLFEMTKFAFYGKTDSDNVNIFIDVYSLMKGLYSRRDAIQFKDSYVIASSIINLAIHLRAYFETRHRVRSTIYIVYGGARPREAIVNYPWYNENNILKEDSNSYLSSLIRDNVAVMQILCPYLDHIYCIANYEAEFMTIAGTIIDMAWDGKTPNIIYSKDQLSYQLVAFKNKTFLYRPKKRKNEDCSWVVTKSTLYEAYKFGELGGKKDAPYKIDIKMFSILQAISGVRSRSLESLKNTNSTIKLLKDAVDTGIFANGYNASSIFFSNPNPFEIIFNGDPVFMKVTNRFAAIDLPYQSMLFRTILNEQNIYQSIIDLYEPQAVRDINDKYFTTYPLDLNRV